MAWAEYLLTVVLVSASGALAPGPLFFAAVVNGVKRGVRSGLYVALGHMVVELPLVSLLALGLLSAVSLPNMRMAMALGGGVALIGFGVFQLLQVFSKRSFVSEQKRTKLLSGSILIGITLSALNPFFILWWFTIGSKLILDALILASLAGVLVMYLAHVWMDYAWLAFVSDLAKRGARFSGGRAYRIVLGAFGIILVYLGIGFFLDVLGIRIIP